MPGVSSPLPKVNWNGLMFPRKKSGMRRPAFWQPMNTKAGDLKKVDTPVLHTAYAYDGDRNLTALRTMVAGDASVEKILADNTYRYNKNGQRTEKTTLAGTTKYMYDVLGQLIQENNHIYTYDRAGNRTSVQTDDRREIL